MFLSERKQRLLLTIQPHLEKTLSDGTDCAGDGQVNAEPGQQVGETWIDVASTRGEDRTMVAARSEMN